MKTSLISLIIFSCVFYYYTEFKREYKVLRILNDSTRIVQYKKLQHYRVAIERMVNGEFIETQYVYAVNCKDLDDCIKFVLFKEDLYNNTNGNDNDKHF